MSTNRNLAILTLTIIWLFNPSSGEANALIAVEGKIESATPTHYILRVKNGRYYHIRKDKLSDLQSEHFRKFDAKVSGTIPMDAIESVTSEEEKEKK